MKIAIIGTAHPFRGGLSAFNERLAKEFIAEGHSVTMFTFTLQYPNFLFPGKTQYTDDPAPEGLKIIRCINSVNPFNWIKVGLKLRKEKFDAVVFCYWMSFMAPCFGTIARVIGKKSKRIALIHNLIPHEKTILDTFLPGYFVRSMNGFTAMAQSVLDEITALDNKNKPKNMTPHPMYDHFGKPMDKNDALTFLGLSDENHYILFFGLVRAYKGLDLLLKAFSDERLRQYPIKLLIAGEFYESPQRYLDIIVEQNLSDHILICADYIPDRDVRAWFSVADIVVQPYKTATQSGISQIAYHFEKPMLVTNVGGLAEIVPNGKAGYVVEPEVSQVANTLVDFFENNRKETLEQGVKEEKKRFQWSNMTKAILSHV